MAHLTRYPATTADNAKGDVTYGTVGVTSGTVQIIAANPRRISLTVQNIGTANVFLGTDNTVTTSKGLLLPGTASLNDTDSISAWWGVVASGTVVVTYMEVS